MHCARLVRTLQAPRKHMHVGNGALTPWRMRHFTATISIAVLSSCIRVVELLH